MEQLSTIRYLLNGSAEGDESVIVPFSLTISTPFYEDDGETVFRLVDYPVIREKVLKIYGVDEAQSLELSFEFISKMIEHHALKIHDENGTPIPLPLQEPGTTT